MHFILLPHQLFDIKYLNSKYYFYLWECPHYFTKYKYNKKKLILHRASMKSYEKLLQKKGYKTHYINFNKKIDETKSYFMFDPIDKVNFHSIDISYIESPNFLLTKNDYSEYRKKTTHFIFNNFYIWSKKHLDIIPNIKSQDKQNRNKLPVNIKVPETTSLNTTEDNVYIKDAIKYVSMHFSENPGNTNNFIYPITHKACKKWLKQWIENKLNFFGKYQDAINSNQSFLFHSVLSSSINIGLINPTDIINHIKQYENTTPLNSYEGYIRQLFWREYQRYCYIYYNFNNKNYFKNKKKLSKKWYYGNLGVLPVDTCIVRAFDLGYLNHIERLMVIGNFMVLFGISPKQGFQWFMEMSCDSYEWVMSQNVLDMVFFVSGGVTMRRPYITSSNYILKMSNYKKGDWCDTWDNLYHTFKKNKKKELYKFRYFFPGL
tara:strand:- start:2029 stop:3324 length:1296 start_codon:yes stop_codon:yes gene_type:complete